MSNEKITTFEDVMKKKNKGKKITFDGKDAEYDFSKHFKKGKKQKK